MVVVVGGVVGELSGVGSRSGCGWVWSGRHYILTVIFLISLLAYLLYVLFTVPSLGALRSVG